MSMYDLGGDPLAAALAQHLAMTGMSNAPARSPTQGASNISSALLGWALQNPQAVQGLRTGLGNLFSGNAWDGMAGMGTMPGLNAQAEANAANLSPVGPPTDIYGSAGAGGLRGPI